MIHAVLKYKTWSPFFPDNVGTDWLHISFGTKELFIENVDEKQARQAIKRHGLILTLKDDDGEIYDTPARDFYQYQKNKGVALERRISLRVEGVNSEIKEVQGIKHLNEIQNSGLTEIGRIKNYIMEAVRRDAVPVEKLLSPSDCKMWLDIMADYMRKAPNGTAVTFPRLHCKDYYARECRKAGDENTIVKMTYDRYRDTFTAFKLPR